MKTVSLVSVLRPRLAFALLLAAVASPLHAHEFWLQPATHFAKPGEAVRLGIRVGEDFTGEVRTINTERVVALRHYSASGVVDLLPRVPAAPGVEFLDLAFDKAGTHLIAEDSAVSTIELSADKFLGYLNSDGLEFIDAARKAAGKDQEPGRERYLRCVKTLIAVGRASAKSDTTYATRTGQRLEIVPATNPLVARPGATIAFTVFFDNKPLAGGLLCAWHHRGGAIVKIKGRTAADGTITFDFPYAGPWMVSLVHMIPITDVPGFDWQSYWGNLTFALPASK